MIKECLMSDGFHFKYDSETLDIVYDTNYINWKRIKLIISIFIFYLLLFSYSKIGLSTMYCKYTNYIIDEDIPNINEYILLDTLISFNCYFPKLVVKQMKLESGNFKSKLYERTSNLMGMKFPIKRNTYSIGSYKGYSIYKNWVECARDYVEYQKYTFTDKYYLDFLLKSGYAEDADYISKLSK